MTVAPLDCASGQHRSAKVVSSSATPIDPQQVCVDVAAIRSDAVPWIGPSYATELEFRLIHEPTGDTVTKLAVDPKCNDPKCMKLELAAETASGKPCKVKGLRVDEHRSNPTCR